MAQQQTEINESLAKANDRGADQLQTKKSSNLQNGTDTQQGGKNSRSGSVMGGEKAKSLAGAAAGGNGGTTSPSSGPPHPPHPGSESAPGMHPYEPSGHHMPPGSNAGPVDPNSKDEMHHHPQHHPMHHPQHHQHQLYGQSPMQHQQYPRYHHDPNMPPGDPYAHYRMGAAPGGKPGSMIPPNRPPPQRYMQGPGGQPPQHTAGSHPGQQPQGPTPTLNSLLQSHPPPQHRYPNSYDPNQPQQPPPAASPGQPGQQQQQQQPPPGPPQSYGHQQSWAPPRPYSPQMGSQPYRPPPPGSNSRGQSPYPPGPPSQSPGSYPASQQQQQQQPPPSQQGGPQGLPSGQQGPPPPPPQGHQPVGQPPPSGAAGSGPPPPPPSSQGPPGSSQYSPYQQRYPTPPGPNAGPNHRSPYPPPHQYEPVRSWPSPAASPGPGGQQQQQSHLPPSPHGPPQSPGQHGAPSPSPQPPQPAQSPHQDSTGQNSNDSSSGGGTGGASAASGTPNSQGMRPSPSPTGSSGSRSMSPAVGQQSIPMPPRPSSSHSQVPNQQAQNQLGSSNNNLGHGNQSQLQQPPDHSRVASPNRPPSVGGPQQGPPGPPPSQASMAAQGYQTQPPHPPHMHGGYKMGPSPGGPGAGMPGPQQMSPYPPHNPQSQQYSPHSQGNYSPRPQYPGGYGPSPPGGQPGQPPPPGPPPNSVASGPGGYPGHRMPNHVGGPPPHSQYPPHQPYQQGWGPPGPGPQVPGGHVNNHQQQQPGKGMPPSGVPPSPQQPNQAQSQQGPPSGGPPQSGSPRPLNYLKQHLQHKGGYGGAPSPTPPQGYGNGPGMHPPMGPPHHMGPPMGPTSMGPPSGAPPNQQGPPPSQPPIGPNSHPDGSLPPQPHHPESGSIGGLDNGVSSSGPGGVPHPVTSLVTTGPDGAPLDEASQQSTLSNTSVASGEDPQCSTPKSRKGDHYNQSHLTNTPTTASPGPHNQHEDFEMNSPTSWPRTPASPVFNSHVPPTETPFRSTKKSDSLNKLYDMDDKPERRPWLDKLLAFMEERRTPITACPTISKTPLDLYKLYILVQERGGFLEVCKVTKSKTWKDIAGLLGIGASSSAAYTLRKHYTKNLLPFECKFDRGGIDPGPIIAQVEAGSKKKSNKTASVPSPGSSNSQDSFPAPGSSSASMDGYNAYPGSGYPPGATPDYQSQPPQQGQSQGQAPTQPPQPPVQQNLQRPPSQQSGTQSPHTGSAPPTTGDNISVSNPFDDPVGPQRPPYQQGAPYPPASRPQGAPYQAQPGSYPYGAPDQYGPGAAPGQYPPGQQGQYPPASRPMYPPYGPPESGEGRSTPPAPNSVPPATGDPYRGYGSAPYPPPPQQRPYQQPPPVSSGPSQTPPAGPPGAASQPPVSGAPGPQPPSTIAQGQGYPTPPQPPQQPDYYRPDQPNQPRRHPDFEKNQQPYPPYQQRPQMYPGGWQGGAGQYRGQYPPQGPQQQWGTHNGPRPSGPPGPPGGPPGAPGTPSQWSADANRYPPSQQQPPYPPHQQGQQQPWNQLPPTSQGSPLRPPPRGGKPFASMQQPGMTGSMPPSQPQNSGPVGPTVGGPTAGPAVSGPPAPSGAGQSGAKPMPPATFPPASNVAPKRDIVFPPDSVESTTPVLYRRKRASKLDIGQTDPWRIFMALRSGLLVESTWALDVLNILLFDDTSVVYFGLTHLPGLLNLLLDHFQKSLSDMFDTKDRKNRVGRAYGWFGKEADDGNDEEEEDETVQDEGAIEDGRAENDAVEIKKEFVEVKVENGEVDPKDGLNVKQEPCIRGHKRARRSYELDLGSVLNPPNPEDRIVVFNSTTNYTMSSRKGLPVKIQPAEDDVFVLNHRKDWDRTADDRYHRETDVGGDPWTAGHSEPDPHDYIMEPFQAEFVNIPFARMIKTSKKYKARCKNNNNNNNNVVKRPSKPVESDDSDSEQSRTNGDGRVVNGESSGPEEDTKPPAALVAEVNNFVVKKEVNEVTPSSDADCREIDMELEKSSLSNGPQDGAGADETDDAKDADVKMEIEEDYSKPTSEAAAARQQKFNVAATVRDPAKVLKRRRMSDYEDECYTRDEASLYLVTEGHDCLARRCMAISNILRNLTFVPGNETEFARSSRFLSILGKLLLLHHEHPMRTKKTRNYDREEDADFSDSCSSLQGESEWWWDFLVQIRENMLVSMANISGQLDLSRFDEPISRPILDGLLHWSVCPSAHGQDPFPTLGTNSVLSPQRLALEALCKLCVTDANVDLVIATPPFTRLEKLCSVLTRHLCKNEDQVLREFSVNLLHYLAAADSAMARTVAMQSPCVSYLVAFIEQAEQTALGVANQHGINYLRDNPDSMGTSLDMLRRAAGTLLHLAKHPDNRPLFMQQEQRLLGLVMSHILDQQVALIISKVLFQCSRGTGPLTTIEIESFISSSSRTAAEAAKKSTEKDSSEAAKSSLHLNSIIANNNNISNSSSSSTNSSHNNSSIGPAMAPPLPVGPSKSSEPLTQLTSSSTTTAASSAAVMPAPSAPVSGTSGPPTFVPPPPPSSTSASSSAAAAAIPSAGSPTMVAGVGSPPPAPPPPSNTAPSDAGSSPPSPAPPAQTPSAQHPITASS